MIRRRQAPEPSGSVYVQPAPHGVWSGNNNFGAEIQFDPELGPRQRVLKLPEWGHPAVWTVSLGIDFAEEVPPITGFEVIAEVTYGTGGATQTVVMDWIQGTTFSVPMNALSIDAVFAPAASAGQPQELTLSALIARGCGETRIPPTKFAALLDGTLQVSLDNNQIVGTPARVPKFARRLFLVPLTTLAYDGLVTASNYIRFFTGPDVTGSALPVGSFRIDQRVLLEGVLVPPFAKYVTLQNQGAGLSTIVQAFYNFELDL